jgi:putative membrane protein
MCGLFVFFWVAVVALMVWVVRRNRPDVRERFSGLFPRADAAEEILRERLARGEIGEEEYERGLSALRR